MTKLKTIGGFFRDPIEPSPPMAALSELCGEHGVTFIDLRHSIPSDTRIDLIIAFGGDGTVLRALERFPDVPVLAVNYGNIGFLTQCESEDLIPTVERVLQNNCLIEERLTLSVIADGWTERAVNEVVIKGDRHMIEVEVAVNGRRISRPRGDGIIVGTPTGSTAYLMSTGAPIVTPEVDCMIINPLNEYSFSSRPIILPGSADVTLDIHLTRETTVSVCVDGRAPRLLETPRKLQIKRAPRPARLVTFNSVYFFDNLRERLKW